jgi:5-hydroxyisourate hydrolase
MMRWSVRILLSLACLTGGSVGLRGDDKPVPPRQNGPLTIHVLNTGIGKPAIGVAVTLERQSAKSWVELGKGTTDENGRLGTLYPEDKRLEVGVYRLVFETGSYFRAQGQKTFFPQVEVVFEVEKADERYHVPLLLSPFAYSTYRGS